MTDTDQELATQETNQEINELDRLLGDVKMQLIYNNSAAFLTAIMYRLNYSWTRQFPDGKPMETMYTDGTSVGLNPDFFKSLPSKDRVYILVHELWHVALAHASRRGDRNPIVWNMAADFVVDLLVEKGNFDVDCGKIDYNYDDLTTEEVYKILMDQLEQQDPDCKECMEKGDPTDNMTEQHKDALKGLGDIAAHEELPGDLYDAGTETQEKEREVQQVILSANEDMRRNGKDPGLMPGELKLLIDKFSKPKLSWNRLLSRYFNSMKQEERSYRRINRRYDTDPFLKGNVGTEGLDLVYCYLDVSGSVSDEDIFLFNSEVSDIKRRFNPDEMRLITFDTRIRNELVLTKDTPFKSIVVEGRGGTSLNPVFRHIDEHRPDVAVIFSDMQVPIPQQKPKSPIIWIVSNYPGWKPPFGKEIHFNT